MKAKVKKEDVVKHWGIYITKDADNHGWMVFDDTGFLYSTTCPRVANVQHDILIKRGYFLNSEIEVRVIK